MGQSVIITRINSINGIKGIYSVLYGPTKRSDSVLMLALRNNPTNQIISPEKKDLLDGNIPCSRCQSNSRLETYNSISLGWIDDCQVLIPSFPGWLPHVVVYSPLPSVSVPSEKAIAFAATAAALPELLPPGLTVKL